MLNGLAAEVGGVGVPPVVKAVALEAKPPAGQNVAAPEAKKSAPAQEAVKKGAEASPGEAGKKTDGAELTAEAVIEVANTIKEAADLKNTVPNAYENGLRAIASGGDLAVNFELSGQALRKKAISAPKEGEGALTIEQRKQMMADGYDMEIGALQLKSDRAQKQEEKQALSRKITALRREKLDKTGIETNSFDDLAKLFIVDEATNGSVLRQISEGRPIAAIGQVLERAVSDAGFCGDLISNFRGSKIFPNELVDKLEAGLKIQAKRKKNEKKVKFVFGMSFGAILMGLFAAYISSKEKQQMAG